MLETLLRSRIDSVLPEKVDYSLARTPDARFGDLACNAAMLLAKKLAKNPRELAAELAAVFESDAFIARVEVAGPGFLNFFLQDGAILAAAADNFALPVIQPKTVLIEYGQENIAKPMSVGHLRSNIIGKSLVNIFGFLGHRVITDNHLGDWGTQFGKLIVAYKKWGDRATIEANPIEEFNKIYVRFHDEVETQPELDDLARAEFKKLEDGDAENRALWQWMRDESLKEFRKMYARLGSEFEFMHGEAFFESALPGVISELVERGIAQKNDDGSIMVSFPEEFSPSPLLIQKSDGATLYATRDLATVRFYVSEFHPDLVLQCVGAEQSLYFRQMYEVARMAGWMESTQFVHVANGLVRLPEGKMSTRSGRIVKLEKLLDEAEDKMRAILDEKNCEVAGESREQLIRDLAIGAIKFADLGKAREGNITFTWESALSFDGYAAPYLQYAHARISSLLEKVGEFDPVRPPSVPPSRGEGEAKGVIFGHPAERALALRLAEFVPAVLDAADSQHPHVVAQYLFELAQEFNQLYQAVPVATAAESERNLRATLALRTRETLRTGLGLLGIAAPDRM